MAKQKLKSGQAVDLSFYGSAEDNAETRSIASRQRLRSQLQGDIESFLKTGGEVTQVANNVRADPPRKPTTSSYGSTPI